MKNSTVVIVFLAVICLTCIWSMRIQQSHIKQLQTKLNAAEDELANWKTLYKLSE